LADELFLLLGMIVRIVRMEFHPDNLETFQGIFDASKMAIRHFPGCLHLELHRDPRHPQVRYTYSHWRSQADLDAYRQSELFGSVWPRTKALFAAPPQAFSLERLEEVS
jgi:quinol monooxygenase YgiN